MSTVREPGSDSPHDGDSEKVLLAALGLRRQAQQAKSKLVPQVDIGFTGTRNGMTEEQERSVIQLMGQFKLIWDAGCIAHHGDCVGSDAQFFKIVRGLCFGRIICHPPSGRSLRAFVGGDVVRDPRPPLDRNTAIVRESDFMIAAPLEMTEQVRGGTWSTIRKARAWGRPLAIVWRDGSISRELWT